MVIQMKAVIDSLKHLWNKKFKDKRKKDGLQGIFFSISDSCLYLVSMKTH